MPSIHCHFAKCNPGSLELIYDEALGKIGILGSGKYDSMTFRFIAESQKGGYMIYIYDEDNNYIDYYRGKSFKLFPEAEAAAEKILYNY